MIGVSNWFAMFSLFCASIVSVCRERGGERRRRKEEEKWRERVERGWGMKVIHSIGI